MWLTAEIEKAEARVHAINEMFCNPGFFEKTGASEVKKLEAEQKTLNTKIEDLRPTVTSISADSVGD